MNTLADISPLVGRKFVAKSNNVCRISKIGDGALRITWKAKPTPEDCDEFMEFAEGILGPLNPTAHFGAKGEAEALQNWKRASGAE